jgi:hypothetical protein
MAYIIRDNYEDKFIKTELQFAESRDALDHFFKTTKAFPGTVEKASWVSGNFIPPEVMPKSVRIIRGGRLYDWLGIQGGATLVSSAFKDAVEQVEAGRHQFFPVTVLDRNDIAREESFFIFSVVGRLDTIIEEQSNLSARGRGQIEAWGYERNEGPWRCAMDASVIDGHACWIEHRYGGRRFMSDKLATLLEQKQLLGFKLSEHCDEI